jgi:hypothetical protein
MPQEDAEDVPSGARGRDVKAREFMLRHGVREVN